MKKERKMNTQEKKAYILKSWSTSNGKRITEMLLRYKTDFLQNGQKGLTKTVQKSATEEDILAIFGT